MGTKQDPKSLLNNIILKEIGEALTTLEYGAVTVKVHASKITQIEVIQRKRFDDVWRIEEGSGI